MAQLNAKTPIESAPQPARPARTGVLPLIGVVAALAIAAGAYVYYQNENESGTSASAPQTTTSERMASAPTEGTSSSQSAMSTPKAGADSANATSAAANAVKPHRVAKASKPERALEPRDRSVVLVTDPHPTYPLQALRAREQGKVLVLAQIDVDGQVTDARVIQRSGSRVLDQAAPNEVRHWKFEPATHNGHPVVASVEVPVNYRLNQ